MFTASRLRRIAVSLVLAVTPLVFLPAARAEHTVAEFTYPGAAQTWLWDINDVGKMVGSFSQGTGATDPGSGFVYDGGTFTLLSGPAGAIWSAALGISDDGKVIGNYVTALVCDPDPNACSFESSHGFIFSGGTYATLDAPGATSTYPRGISPDGRYISGWYVTPDAWTGFVYDTATAVWTDIQPSAGISYQTIVQGINGSGVVVGSFSSPTRKTGFRYEIATSTITEQSITGMTRTAFRAIDDAGTLAGYFVDASGVSHGFVGSVTSYETIDFGVGNDTLVQGINNAGALVGNFANSLSGTPVHAFIATPAVTPEKLLQQLAVSVSGIGPGISLLDKVTLAQTYYAAGDTSATCAVLTDLVSQVRAQSGKKIQPEKADQLIASAQAIRGKIGCN